MMPLSNDYYHRFSSNSTPSMNSIAGIYPDCQEIPDFEDPRMINRLINNLAYLFNIEGGDYLTFILGYGHCTRNEDALRYWVIDQLQDISINQDDVMNVLVDHLRTELMREDF